MSISNKLNLQFFATQGMVTKKTIGSVDPDASGSRLEIRCEKEIAQLDPNEDPFIVMMLQAKKKPVDTIRYEYYDDEPMPWWTTAAAAAAANAVSLTLADASILTAGQIIKIPRTGEEIRVGAVNADSNAISGLTRGYGSTAAATIVADDDVLVMPNAMEDGYSTPEAISTQPTLLYNYVQTFNTPVKVSNHAEEVALRAGGSERNRLRRSALFQHRLGMERIALFGERFHDAGNGIYKTGGLLPRITTNVFDFASADITETEFDDCCIEVLRHGSRNKLFVTSDLMIAKVSRFAKERVQVEDGVKAYGLSLSSFRCSSGGKVILTPSRLFENYYAGWGFFVDMKNAHLRMFNDTRLRKDLQPKTVHGKIDEYETEFGTQFRLQKTHGVIKNVKTD
jgi:hypothetical protein